MWNGVTHNILDRECGMRTLFLELFSDLILVRNFLLVLRIQNPLDADTCS